MATDNAQGVGFNMRRLLLLAGIWLSFSPTLRALEAASCQTIRLADIGWTDVSATTALSAEILQALGYEPKISMLSMPVTFAGLKNQDLDVFMGNWMPTQEADIRPYLRQGSVVQWHKNLEGARYTLAVPEYVYNAGVRSFADLRKHAKQLESRIYAIEPGNDGNRLILKMIADDAFGLKSWQVMESSEQGMLVAVKQAVARGDWVVFLGWAPHPMNLDVKMKYLEGGDAYFGPGFGASSVFTTTRRGYAQQCPNVAGVLRSLTFSVELENRLMSLILNEKLTPKEAAQKWLGQNANVAMSWLHNQKSRDGSEAALALKKHLFRINNFGDSPSIGKLPLGRWMESGVLYLTSHFSSEFRRFSSGLEWIIEEAVRGLLAIPSILLLFFFGAVAYFLHRSIRASLLVVLGFMLILNLGLWVETMQTLVLVLASSLVSVLLGVSLGVLAARKPWVYGILHPTLDFMQTIPTFVYLIPTLMLFGLGVVPGLISTVIFALAAPIRLTYLGLRGVPQELIEASQAFGATRLQQLVKVELPHAWPSIMAGLTQCIMLSLSMVVIAALVGAEGLGTPVVRALNTVNIRQGFESGIAIVILAIVLDRTLNWQRGRA